MDDQSNRLLRVDEVACELGVRISDIYRLISSGLLPYRTEPLADRAGVKVRISRGALDDYLDDVQSSIR